MSAAGDGDARRTSTGGAPAPSGPVFIVGQARSGSSIAFRLVQGHPRFRPPRGENLAESHFMRLLGEPGPFDGRTLRAFSGVRGPAWQSFLAEHRATDQRRRRVVALLRRRTIRRAPLLWVASGALELAQAYIALAATSRGAARLVEKTPGHLPWVPHLLRAFPDARAICITRHPIPTYASFRRRAAADPEARWADISPESFASRWRAEVALAERWHDREPTRFLHLRYEALVSDPDQAQRSLFTWLGEAPLDELPGRVERDAHAPTGASTLFGEITPTSTRWRSHLDDDTARRIEAALSAPMAKLGYTRLAPRPGGDR